MAEPMKLTLELFRFEEVIVGRCSYLDKDLRGTGILAENTKCQIVSGESAPGIAAEEGQKIQLNVWGNAADTDKTVLLYRFSDVESAEEFAVNVKGLCGRINGTNLTMREPVRVMG